MSPHSWICLSLREYHCGLFVVGGAAEFDMFVANTVPCDLSVLGIEAEFNMFAAQQ